MGVGNLLRTYEDVERVQDVASTYANVMQGSGRNVIQELGELKNILREQEKAFYRSIGKTREQFLLMYQTADVLISQIDAGLYKPREGILDKYALKTDLQALLNQFANALTTTLAQDNSPLMLETRQESKKIAEAKVVEEIAKTAMQHGGVTFSTKTSRRNSQSKNKQNIGLGKFEFSFVKGKDGKKQLKVSLKEGETFPQSLTSRIKQFVKTNASKEVNAIEEAPDLESEKIDRKQFDEDVINFLRQSGLGWIEPIVRKDAQQIFVNRNRSVIIGYFGELRAHAIFKKLFGDIAIPTGTIKKLGDSGASLPIDEVLKIGAKIYGFQIKNYTPKKGGYIELHNELNAFDFLKDRLYISGSPLEILTEFFASYQYNQPFEQNERNESLSEGEMSIGEYREQVYSKFNNIFQSFTEMFTRRVGYMIKIQDCFAAASGGLFQKKEDYYNNFFIVKGRIIPSSDIIEQIQEQLMNSAIGYGPVPIGGTVSYTLKEPTDRGSTLQKFLSTPDHVPNLNLLARKIRIGYRVTIKL